MDKLTQRTIQEYCYEIRRLREALNNAIAAGELLRHQLADAETDLSKKKRQMAFDLLEKATAVSLKG